MQQEQKMTESQETRIQVVEIPIEWGTPPMNDLMRAERAEQEFNAQRELVAALDAGYCVLSSHIVPRGNKTVARYELYKTE